MCNVLPIKSQGISPSGKYIPRGRTVLHTILDKHFNSFVENYEVKYSEECGRYSLERIVSVVEEYLKCDDYRKEISEIKLIYFFSLFLLRRDKSVCLYSTLLHEYPSSKVIIENAKKN
jgi:hypothetical protein